MPWTLITGSAKGLGREIALHLSELGHDVIIHYHRSQQEAEETAFLCSQKGVHTEIFQADFRKDFLLPEKDYYGLVNNVGSYLPRRLSQTSEREWMDLFMMNVHIPFFIIKKLLASIQKNKGRIVNLGTAGILSPRTNIYCPSYEISKSALWNLTRNLAKEVSSEEVTVNMVSPGIMTNSWDKEEKGHLIPMRRFCSFQEVAEVIGFLFKSSSSYITGQNIEVAGGFGL